MLFRSIYDGGMVTVDDWRIWIRKKEKEETWDWPVVFVVSFAVFYVLWLGREHFGEVSNLGSSLAYVTGWIFPLRFIISYFA